MNPKTDVRTHVILPKEILATIDRLVGSRQRSRFLAEAARREIAYRELVELAHAAAGSAKGAPSPWGETAESIAQWMHDLREEDHAGDVTLDAVRARLDAPQP